MSKFFPPTITQDFKISFWILELWVDVQSLRHYLVLNLLYNEFYFIVTISSHLNLRDTSPTDRSWASTEISWYFECKLTQPREKLNFFYIQWRLFSRVSTPRTQTFRLPEQFIELIPSITTFHLTVKFMHLFFIHVILPPPIISLVSSSSFLWQALTAAESCLIHKKAFLCLTHLINYILTRSGSVSPIFFRWRSIMLAHFENSTYV